MKRLMAASGAYGVNKKDDGNVSKYARYLGILFDDGVISDRSQLFEPGARQAAYAYYQNEADFKFLCGTGRTPAKKLFTNYKRGFDTFVALADASAGAPPSPG